MSHILVFPLVHIHVPWRLVMSRELSFSIVTKTKKHLLPSTLQLCAFIFTDCGCWSHFETVKGWVETDPYSSWVSPFIKSYSAGSHGGAVKIPLDLDAAEYTLQCFSHMECVLLTWQTTFVQPWNPLMWPYVLDEYRKEPFTLLRASGCCYMKSCY